MPIPRCGRPSAAIAWAMCWPCPPTGACPPTAGRIRVDRTPRPLPQRAWQKHSAGTGSHGQRYYSWAWITLLAEDDADTGRHYLLIRRNDATGELAYLRCYSPRPVTLHALVTVAGQRWRIEESFQAAKGLTGLDQHQVRRWTSWHRWTTLAMLAHAFLAVATADRTRHPTHPDWSDHVDRQRVSPPLRRSAADHPPHHHQPAGLVTMATTTPIPSPTIPLPTTGKPMITNYGCSTKLGFPSYRRDIALEEVMAMERRNFDRQFREGAVRIVRETGKPIAQVARELGVHEGTLGRWVNLDRRVREGEGPLSESERDELNRLRKENAELGMEREVLKRSAALWVKEATE